MTKNFVLKTIASEKTKGAEYILSDASVDRYGDIILSDGWQLDAFRRNPIALFSHQSTFPIGTWKNVRVEAGALRGTLQLAPKGSSDRIDEIRMLCAAGVLRAVSVGFTPLEYEERKGDEYGMVYKKQELVECSLVSVPANSNALQVARSLKISDDTQRLVFSISENPTYTKAQSRAILARARAILARGSPATTKADARAISDASSLLGPRMIHGIVSSERVVDHAHSSDGSNQCVMLARGFPLDTSVSLLLNHQGPPIGKVIHLQRIGAQIYLRALIHDSKVWRKIEAYELRGLSCGVTFGHHHEIKIDEKIGVVKYFDQYSLKEISIVDKPANGDCYLKIFSGGFEGRVADQLSLSEHRRIKDRARRTIARLTKKGL